MRDLEPRARVWLILRQRRMGSHKLGQWSESGWLLTSSTAIKLVSLLLSHFLGCHDRNVARLVWNETGDRKLGIVCMLCHEKEKLCVRQHLDCHAMTIGLCSWTTPNPQMEYATLITLMVLHCTSTALDLW